MENLDLKQQIGPQYSEVTEQHDKIIILASSTEARKFRALPDYAVIAVNAAIHIARNRADYWITCDPSDSNMKLMRETPYRAKYYAAVPDWFGTKYAKLPRLNCPIPENVNYLRRVEGHEADRYIKYGLSEYKDSIHTGNSAYAALNLAYHMNPKEIIILGVNGGDNRLKFDNSNCIGSLQHLPALFASAVRQLEAKGIKVYNANRYTALTCFEKTDIFEKRY